MDASTKKYYITRINKLSKPRFNSKSSSVDCGEFGIVRLDHAAKHDIYGKRIFIVSKSKKIANGGNWTFSGLRKAILAAD